MAADDGAAYPLRLLNVVGGVLAEHPLPLPEVSDDIGPARPSWLIVPYPVGMDSLVITRDGTEIARRAVSPNAPTVHVVYPNGGEVPGPTLTIE